MKYDFHVQDDEEGLRLDKFLCLKLGNEFSRTFLQKLIQDGACLVDLIAVNKHLKLKSGQKVDIEIPERAEIAVTAEDIPLDTLYEDDDLVIVNKPSNMVTHPAVGNYSGTLVNALLSRCKKLSCIGGPFRPGIVHRLDKDTSGVMVAAKTDRAHISLAEQFKAHSIKRKYVAFVKGKFQSAEGVVDLPIARHPTDRKKMAVSYTGSKQALTKYKVLKYCEEKDFSVIEASPQTGRTHQIRVHMAYIGHPILGDQKYGSKRDFPRQALHAIYLQFVHPVNNKEMVFEAGLPKDMKDFLEKLSCKW